MLGISAAKKHKNLDLGVRFYIKPLLRSSEKLWAAKIRIYLMKFWRCHILVSNTVVIMIDILYILFRPYGPIMLPIPLITIILMLATKIRNYRDNFIVYPELPFVQPPKNLESSRLNLFVLFIIFVGITGHQFYSWRQVKFILIIIYVFRLRFDHW